MAEDKETFTRNFVENYIQNWTRNAGLFLNMEYKDTPYSNSRIIARTIGETIWDMRRHEEKTHD